jgi:hypothetical protein
MAKFTRRIEPYAGKSANWKATLLKGEKIVFSMWLFPGLTYAQNGDDETTRASFRDAYARTEEA